MGKVGAAVLETWVQWLDLEQLFKAGQGPTKRAGVRHPPIRASSLE